MSPTYHTLLLITGKNGANIDQDQWQYRGGGTGYGPVKNSRTLEMNVFGRNEPRQKLAKSAARMMDLEAGNLK